MVLLKEVSSLNREFEVLSKERVATDFIMAFIVAFTITLLLGSGFLLG